MFQLYDISRDTSGRDNGITIENVNKSGLTLKVLGMSSPRIKALQAELRDARPADFTPQTNDAHLRMAIRDGQTLAIEGLLDVPGGVALGDDTLDMSDRETRERVLRDERFTEFGDLVIEAMNQADVQRIKWQGDAVKNSGGGSSGASAKK